VDMIQVCLVGTKNHGVRMFGSREWLGCFVKKKLVDRDSFV
jgi:hypothetical protein